MKRPRKSPQHEVTNFEALTELAYNSNDYRLAVRFFDSHISSYVQGIMGELININEKIDVFNQTNIVFLPSDNMIIRFAREIAGIDDINTFLDHRESVELSDYHVPASSPYLLPDPPNDSMKSRRDIQHLHTNDNTLRDGLSFISYASTAEEDVIDIVVRSNIYGDYDDSVNFVLTNYWEENDVKLAISNEPLIPGSHVYGIDGIRSNHWINDAFEISKGGLFIYDLGLHKFSRNYDSLIKIDNLQTRALIKLIKGKSNEQVDNICNQNQILRDVCNTKEFEYIRKRFVPIWLDDDIAEKVIEISQYGTPVYFQGKFVVNITSGQYIK